MALKNKSEVNIIQGPEFIDLQPLDVNPLMSKCEIKVFYLGHNRNGSYINKTTATEMAKTLRGTPIVAAWREEKEDFGDHGHVITIEDNEIKFSCKTIPYGFVSPDAKIWFQNFTDTDEFDNAVERTYLMTTGYLWTGQFEELTKVINEGQPHSMELDSETLQGHWATDNNLGVDFFIINDATFSKLCILGDDVEPCYEGSSITSPEVSKNFSNNPEFAQTLFTMMNDLQVALNSKGGLDMSLDENQEVETQEEEVVEDFQVSADEDTNAEEFTEEEDVTSEEENTTSEEEDAASEDENQEFTEDENEDESTVEESVVSAEQFNLMNEELESLRAEVANLRQFKLDIENKEKDALINRYFMLSDEDKADVIAHKAEYSLETIEAKLALIYVEKNVDFNVNDETEVSEDEKDVTVTFSLDEDDITPMSPLQAALHKTIANN